MGASGVSHSLQLAAAEALLQLRCSSSCERQSPSSLSDSCSSSSTSSVFTRAGSPHRVEKDPLILLAIAADYLEKRCKPTKRRRSRTYQMSVKPTLSSDSAEGSTQSATSVVRRGWTSKKAMLGRADKSANPSLRRRASAILQLLSSGCASEIKIRAVLGDSPDTSKALRMLLKLEEVRRSGCGGRGDPFLYEVTGPQSDITSA